MKIILEIVAVIALYGGLLAALCGYAYLLLKYIKLSIGGCTTDKAVLADRSYIRYVRYRIRKIYVEYTAENGGSFYALAYFSGLVLFKKGKPVTVIYDPNKPDKVFIKGARTLVPIMMWIAFFLLVGIFILFFLSGLWK